MKRKLIYPILLFIALPFTGCEKYLDQLPDQRTLLNNGEKLSELLVSAYPSGNYITFCEAMSDNVTDNFGMGTNDETNTNGYAWRDVTAVNQDSPIYYWNNAYRAIAAANEVLKAIADAGDPAEFASKKGEALVARAYAHFMLVNLFAKFYNNSTSGVDMGVPYVEIPETVVWKNYERNTVSSVYEKIERDLVAGLPLIVDNYKTPSYHFTRKAAHAFAVRFYLFKKDYAQVVNHANLAFPEGNIANNMRDMNGRYAAFGSEEFAYEYTKSDERANILLGETTSWWARRFRQYRYSTTSALLNSVIQGTVAGNLTAIRTWSLSSQSFYTRKFMEHFVRTSINATTGVGYNMVPLFSTEEVLLSRAEALAYLGQYESAMADLNAYAKNRIKVADYSSSRTIDKQKIKTYFYNELPEEQYTDAVFQEGLIQSCLQFRRAEFMHEGLRWFDILRYNIPVTHAVYGGASISLPADDLRRVLQLPEEVKLSNVELNPRPEND
ncbi:RagB/SusD family nutrient uptake outer membrane protein [Sphingobacterium bambusae]|uniref:RagB/SusD family nutrient uptake outer membrane protein n=1 Tax=Sphingobacterium bambusae TaxID=662858 RepID=A0ABW6BJ17_9SPHI|nr:RagB/SusD family nutrient uptake outer membrane protein [Sphingobacterium bambusae]WPL49659.1 RagB/SusD family nutrient uptake outer membrane protein [Sphingobacterium bambusae]